MSDPFGDGDLGEMLRRPDDRFDSPESRERYFQVLVRMATNPERRAREAAAVRLGWFLADPDGRAEGLIRSLITDPEGMVRYGAARAALRQGSADLKGVLAPRIVDALLDALHIEQGLERAKLISWLGRFPSHAPAILPAMIEALGSADQRERCNGSNALGGFGAAAAPAAVAIRRALERETDSWITPDWTMDLRLVHARNLFWVIGDNPWSRAVIIETYGEGEVPEQIRRWTVWFSKKRARLKMI